MEQKKMSEEEKNSVCEAQVESGEKNSSAGCDKKKCCCKKVKKIALAVVGVIVVLLALVVIFRDLFIPVAVSNIGSFALGTEVKLEKFSSSLTGKVDIQGLSVANPAGYHNPNAFVLERVYVDLSVLSLLTDEIVINKILVTGMQIDLEAKLNRTNLGELQKNVERLIPAGGESAPEEEKPAEEKKSQKQVVIGQLDINNNVISFSNSALHFSAKIPLVPISMTDIGRGQSVAETVNEIFAKILTSVFDACSGAGAAIGNSLKDAGAVIGDSAKNLGTAVGDSAKELGKGISDAAGKLFKQFGK